MRRERCVVCEAGNHYGEPSINRDGLYIRSKFVYESHATGPGPGMNISDVCERR